MRKILLFISCTLLLFIFNQALAHSVQVAYCTSCDGNVRVWVEHWHGNEDPNGTTMTLQVEVNGVVTNHVGSPHTSVLGMGINDLECASAITVFGACQARANTENDWVAYDFPNLPLNTPITITVVAGHTQFTQDGCGMFPASTGMIIIPPPPNYSDMTECRDPNGNVGPITTSSNSTWVNDNPGIGVPASGTGDIPLFTPPVTGASQVANFTVTNPCGTSTFKLTILPSPTAGFTANGNPANPVCLGESSSFSDNSNPVQNSNITNWSWDFGDGSPPDNGQNPSHIYAQAGQYTVQLTVTDGNTCTNTESHDVFVSPTPLVDFLVDSVCEGISNTMIDASSVDNTHGDVINAWEWDFGNGQGSTNQNPTHNYANENQYSVSLKLTTNNGCVDSLTKTALVYPLPVAEFSVSDECLNASSIFTDQSTVSNNYSVNNVVTWSWDFDDGSTSNAQNPIHSYGSVGNYSTSLIVTTDKGCSDTISYQNEVFELPNADFSFVNACDNEELILQDASISNASGNLLYDWDVDQDSVLDYSIDTTTHVFGQDGFHNVRLIVENSNGCRDTVFRQVTVYALPVADFTFDEVCEDTTTTFNSASTINPVDNDVISQYNWSFGDGNSSAQQNPLHQYGSENIYQAQLEVITNYGCKDSIIKAINVFPLPISDFTASNECLNAVSVFTDQSTVSNAHTNNTIIDWEWDFDDGNGDTTQNTSNLYSNHGVYNPTLTVVTNNGCTDSFTTLIEVFELPIANFDYTNACDNEEIELVNTSTENAPGSLIFDWDVDNDSLTDYTVDSLGHVFNQGGFHDVRLIVENSNGCRDTLVQEITVYALPTSDFEVEDVCEDTTSTFLNLSSIQPVDGDTIINYDWNFGDGNLSSQENPVHDFGSENIYQTQFLVTTNFGCKDSVTKSVTVYPLPIVEFSPTEVCLEFNTQFTDESTVSNAYTANHKVGWIWDFGDGDSSNVQHPSHAYFSDGYYNASLTVVTNNGCIDSKTNEVVVHPKPMVDFEGVNLKGCSPVCPEISSMSTINSPSSLDSYLWELSNGVYYEGSNPVLEDCYSNETGQDESYDLTLTVTSNEGCVEVLTKKDYIEVYHNPVADFYYSPEKINVIDPVVDFHNTSLYADSYVWNFGSYTQSTEVNPTIAFYPEPEIYNTELIAHTVKGCTDTVRQSVEIEDKLVFYVPNAFTPDQNKFNEDFIPVFTSGYDPKSYVMYIYNRWGELVFETQDVNVGWSGTYGADRNRKVKEGVYVWKIHFNTTRHDEKKVYTGHVTLLR